MRVDCMPLERRNSLILFKVFILRKEFNQELFSFSMKLFLNLYKPTILEIKSDLHDDIPITFLSFLSEKNVDRVTTNPRQENITDYPAIAWLRASRCEGVSLISSSITC